MGEVQAHYTYPSKDFVFPGNRTLEVMMLPVSLAISQSSTTSSPRDQVTLTHSNTSAHTLSLKNIQEIQQL